MKRKLLYLLLLAMTGSILVSCGGSAASSSSDTDSSKPEADPNTLLGSYGEVFGYSGTCITSAQLGNADMLQFVKTHFNSVTMENEMKPEAILGQSPMLVSIDKAKELGYSIPDGYTEENVPRLNFSIIDASLDICAQNGLAMRAHTLVWHSQTPGWFFCEGYQNGGGYVSPEVMDKRMEFYIKNVMGHIYDHENGSIVYAWDVVNEYPHAENSGWEAVYGKGGNSPQFVKKAFETASAVLEERDIRDKVSLFFNDYNTYMVSADILKIVEFINADKKLCDGVGMQAHLDTGYPSDVLFKTTLKQFCDAGLEVQITELDVTCSDLNVQADYYYKLMKGILEVKEQGGNITGITYWGPSDLSSWRRAQKPLLFSTPGNKKPAYDKVMQAFKESSFS